ncbi:hypothetical protein [Novosphingobium sp. JCM 18896]|uniref:hypothetical protein n=1 Tax=Novosphingobium sp. JCM 18896 TaxID=2989731 RepID=UPI002223B732|nr:hypothetical protein [Novosphingobium sp. JCM 18896]MCW1428647.1 hypothetical protein [Novosphingobium sp. JCM 18896]
MATFSFLAGNPQEAVEAAARSLVSVVHAGGRSTVSLPMVYPSGTVAAVEITQVGADIFELSDCGLAHAETEMIGGEHLFARNAAAVAQRFEVSAGKRTIYFTANLAQLAGAMADVAAASVQVAHRVCERISQRSESEIEERLYRKLIDVFGKPKVEQDATISGASAHKWRVSALVHLDGRQMAFEAVSNHHSSVYSSATMFHDLSLLDRKPIPIAVVRDKRAMGDYLRILAQAANVIQDDAAVETLKGLAA